MTDNKGGLEKVIRLSRSARGPSLIVVTGGAGFLGSNIVDALASRGDDVLIFDNLERPRVTENLAWLRARHPLRVKALIGDVRDAPAIRNACRGAAAVVHLAAQVAVTTSIDDPLGDFETNARGTLNVLEAVRAVAPEAPVVFASTNKVYGKLMGFDALDREGDRYVPRDPARRAGLDESTPLSFYSPYGCSKGVADQYVLDYGRIYGLHTTVFRMSCLYGPRQFGTEDQGWVAHFAISALRGRPITMYGDGLQVRDVLYADDAVRAYLQAIDEIEPLSGRAFNLGGGPTNTVSLRELVARLEKLTGRSIVSVHEDWRPGDQPWYVSDTAALKDACGWRPAVGIDAGLERLMAWLRDAFPAHARGPVSAASGAGRDRG